MASPLGLPYNPLPPGIRPDGGVNMLAMNAYGPSDPATMAGLGLPQQIGGVSQNYDGDPEVMRQAYAEQEARLGPMRLPSETSDDGLGLTPTTRAMPVSSGGDSDWNWLTAIGAGLQSAGAAHFGNYNVPQQYFQMKQQADMRKEMFAQQQAQAEEAKRQHNMLMTEKLIQTGNLDALNAFGKEFAPAGLIGSAMAQKDLAEVPSLVKGGYLDQTFVESIFDKDPSKRPTPGQIKAHVDFAKEMFKEDYKANVKNAALDKALALPPEKRSPGQQRLVDDHQTEIELKKAQTEEHSAKAIKALEGDDAKLSYGIDRVSIAKERFGLAPKDLTPEQMGMVNQEYKELQGFLSGQRAKESQQAQLSIPDKLPLAHVEKIMDDIQAVQHVENLKSMFDADKMGRIRGTLGGVAEWAGLLGTDESTLRAEVATMKNAIIKARSGLAVTEAEGKRIDKETPNMTDSPTIFAAKLKLTERNLRALANKRRQLYKQAGYDISHIAPLDGQEGVAAGAAPQQQTGGPFELTQAEMEIAKQNKAAGMTKEQNMADILKRRGQQ